MAQRSKVTVEGARELRSSLRKAGRSMEQIKDVHRKIGGIVVHRAKINAPVRSGQLQSTIRVGATQTASLIRAGYARVPYAGPIHWGWPKRNIKAQQFIRSAANETEAQWIGLAQNELQKILNQVKGA
ncbi:HK97-gp10 family putative phage morphogenesis protein [Canibacter zhoujuaniae]|uniref:HK97-gp10 family putative phage morphogenesis protein n=1 Tax=Canibacter zhoujuaniae TaxID=2708343 RepID=UPI001423D5EE|nr:HK97-gp10 family putative phage morphogenesis protein [Canibacter zhoujuaniae]